jgi:hypothetical protein
MNKYEEIGRKAFWGYEEYSSLLSKRYPNGCTLREAIDYFIEQGKELERSGLI